MEVSVAGLEPTLGLGYHFRKERKGTLTTVGFKDLMPSARLRSELPELEDDKEVSK